MENISFFLINPSHSPDEEGDINEPLWWWIVNDSAKNGFSIILLFCNTYTEDVQISVSNHSLLSHNHCCLSIHILESPFYFNFSSLLSPSLLPPQFLPFLSLILPVCFHSSPLLFPPRCWDQLTLELRSTLYLNILIRKIILNL